MRGAKALRERAGKLYAQHAIVGCRREWRLVNDGDVLGYGAELSPTGYRMLAVIWHESRGREIDETAMRIAAAA